MLELTWPGKVDAAQRAKVCPSLPRLSAWEPQSLHPMVASPQPGSAPSEQRHRIFAGDNLQVLHWLKNGCEKFDVIYIDPPYNTGSALTYHDKKSASRAEKTGGSSAAWLNEIYPRLLLAHQILRDNGILFVSIDDHEACHLLTILREIFGHANHLGTIKWRRKRKPSFLDRHLSTTLEYVLVFARDANQCPRLLGSLTEEATRPVLNASNKMVERVIPKDFSAHCADGHYPAKVYQNRSLSFELLDPLIIEGGRVQHAARVRGRFRIQQELWDQTGFITKNFGLRRRVLAEEQKRRHAQDDGTQWPTNEDAQEELKSLFGERIFDFPKPVGLLTQLLAMVPHADPLRPQRCLDFYAGSGTFLIAALEQTRVDGIRRTVDLVQSREKIRTPSSHQYSDIAEICAHRVFADSLRRGFSVSIDFLQLEQQE